MLTNPIAAGNAPVNNALMAEGLPPLCGSRDGPQKFHQIGCDLVRFMTSLCEVGRNNMTEARRRVEQALEPFQRGNWR
jgi:hypothetical protein